MKILIIGDRHAGGYGLTAGQLSFVGHFIRQISKTGRAVSVEAYAHSTLSAVQETLAKLPLERYDLIIVQSGKGYLEYPKGVKYAFLHASECYLDLSDVLRVPEFLRPGSEHTSRTFFDRCREAGRLLLLKSLTLIGKVPQLRILHRELTNMLVTLRPYRHKVILLTPFPHQESSKHWLRQQVKAWFMQSEVRHAFSVFDTDLVVQPREEYFLSNSAEYLNAIGHELVGQALFDYYLAAPTIVAIHPIRRT